MPTDNEPERPPTPDRTQPPAALGTVPSGPVEASFAFVYNAQIHSQLLGLFARDASAKPKPND